VLLRQCALESCCQAVIRNACKKVSPLSGAALASLISSVTNSFREGLFGLGGYLAQCGLEPSLLNLLYFRVSQINGCAYCLDMHSKDLRAAGETEQRLYLLDAWRESPGPGPPSATHASCSRR